MMTPEHIDEVDNRVDNHDCDDGNDHQDDDIIVASC